MKLRPILASILLSTGLAGCATFTDSELGQIRHSGVSPAVVGKFEQGRVLTPPEIIELTRRGVADDLIVRQIHEASVDYILTRNDIKELEAARVSRPVMDALIAESSDFAASHAPPGPPHAYAAYPGYPAYPYYDYYGAYPYYNPYPYGTVVVGGGYWHRGWR